MFPLPSRRVRDADKHKCRSTAQHTEDPGSVRLQASYPEPPFGTGDRLDVSEFPAEASVAVLPDDEGTGAGSRVRIDPLSATQRANGDPESGLSQGRLRINSSAARTACGNPIVRASSDSNRCCFRHRASVCRCAARHAVHASTAASVARSSCGAAAAGLSKDVPPIDRRAAERRSLRDGRGRVVVISESAMIRAPSS